jgi:hypothetical protein
MGSLAVGRPTNEDTEEVAVHVPTLLDKKTDGELILLDWNAFEPASVLREPELKDIHQRLCPQLDYGTIRGELQKTVATKRAAMLAMAKDMVFEKILTECHLLQVKIPSGTMVTSKTLLNAFMKESSDEDIIEQITTTCFKKSPRWKEDMTQRLIETFGIHYDESTIVENKNKKGNGFLEKIVSKALNNVRLDLRAVQTRASAKGSRSHLGSGAKRKSTSSSSDEEETNSKRVSGFLEELFEGAELEKLHGH